MIQMKICLCGNHCCHNGEVKKQRIYDKNELGNSYSFVRRTCGECGQWLGDKIVKAPVRVLVRTLK